MFFIDSIYFSNSCGIIENNEVPSKSICCTTPISIVAVSVFKTAHLYNGESKILSKGLSKYSTMNLSRLSFDISNDSTLTTLHFYHI